MTDLCCQVVALAVLKWCHQPYKVTRYGTQRMMLKHPPTVEQRGMEAKFHVTKEWNIDCIVKNQDGLAVVISTCALRSALSAQPHTALWE
jgi:hypothetical protein